MDAWKVNYEECQVQSLWLAYKFKGFCKKSNFKIKCVLWYLAKKKKPICIQIQGIVSKTHALSNHEGLLSCCINMSKTQGKKCNFKMKYAIPRKKIKKTISIILEYICGSVFTYYIWKWHCRRFIDIQKCNWGLAVCYAYKTWNCFQC